MADTNTDAPAPTKRYKVREGFYLHPRDGSEALPGGTELELTEADAAYFAAQIELADPADIKAALAAEAKAAKASADAAR